MKRFLLTAALFGFGLLLINAIVLFTVAPFVRDESYLASARAAPAESRGLLLADSHGTRLDGAILAAAGIANLSAGSDSYADMRNKLRWAVENLDLELVVVSADGHMMSKYREYTNNLDKSSLLVGGSGLKAGIRRLVPLLDARSRDLFKGALSARLARAFSAARKVGTPASDAASPAAPSAKESAQAWAERVKRRADMQYKFGESSERLKAELAEMAAICKERGIRLVGLRFPLHGDYLRELAGKDYGAAAALRELGIPVLDFESLYAEKNDFFEDPDHLGPEGGPAFTKLLVETLRERGEL